MPADQTKDITHLFYLALDWYKAHPGEQIPLAMWEEKADDYGVLADEWCIKVGNREILNIQASVIPAVAAINLGLQPHDVMAIIKHHGMDSNDFLGCVFNKLINEKQSWIPGTEKPFVLDAWSVCREIVNAMCLDKELSEDLVSEFPMYNDTYGTTYEFEFACLLSSNENLWPITYLEKQLKNRITCAEPTAGIPSVTCMNSFQFTSLDFDDLTNDQILTILNRSGNLHHEVISENGFDDGFTNNFFKDLFLGASENKNLFRVVEAINNVDDPDLISKVNDRLIQSLSDFDVISTSEGIEFMRMIEIHLDEDRYPQVSKNIILKLNSFPLSEVKEIRESNYLALQYPSFDEFDEAGNKILKRLYEELRDLETKNFRRPHFRAIGTVLDDWTVAQDLSDIDLQGFLINTLSALEAYRDATHYDCNGAITSAFVDSANRNVESLSLFVARNAKVDYQRLSQLPSSSKAFLAANGFEIKKLPGINRRDKGQLLSEGMGL